MISDLSTIARIKLSCLAHSSNNAVCLGMICRLVMNIDRNKQNADWVEKAIEGMFRDGILLKTVDSSRNEAFYLAPQWHDCQRYDSYVRGKLQKYLTSNSEKSMPMVDIMATIFSEENEISPFFHIMVRDEIKRMLATGQMHSNGQCCYYLPTFSFGE